MPDAVLNVCVTALARRVALNYLECSFVRLTTSGVRRSKSPEVEGLEEQLGRPLKLAQHDNATLGMIQDVGNVDRYSYLKYSLP